MQISFTMQEETQASSNKEKILSAILKLRGVDGYVRINQAYEIIDSSLPDGVDRNEMLNTARNMIVNQRPLGMLDNTVLLTEKGVLMLAQIEHQYLMLIAGYQESVDVTKLIDLVELLKKEV